MKLISKVIASSLLTIGMTSGAAAYTINDLGSNAFIGQGTTNGSPMGDVFGGGNYQVQGMNVNHDQDFLYVTVFTNFNEVGNGRYDFGDLFIDVDGWTPDGTAPNYTDDVYDAGLNGWDYAVLASKERETGLPDSKFGYGGGLQVGDLIDLSGADLLMSDEVSAAYNDSGVRQDQEVGYQSGGADVGDASVVVDTAASINTLSFQIALSDLGLQDAKNQEIGLRWTMTCANDITEGSYNVPEPGTLALLGLGLLGLGLRKRVKS
jgi:hypothetical protein